MTIAAVKKANANVYPPMATVATVLGSITRWLMLRIMTDGEAYGSSDLASMIGINASAAYQHMAVLREAGIVEPYRGRLYRITRAYLPEPGKPLVDLGHCLLRLDVQPAAPPA